MSDKNNANRKAVTISDEKACEWLRKQSKANMCSMSVYVASLIKTYLCRDNVKLYNDGDRTRATCSVNLHGSDTDNYFKLNGKYGCVADSLLITSILIDDYKSKSGKPTCTSIESVCKHADMKIKVDEVQSKLESLQMSIDVLHEPLFKVRALLDEMQDLLNKETI